MKETYLFILLRKECVIIINDEISNAHLILFAIIRRLGKRSIQICFLVLSKSIYEYKLFINLSVMYIFSVCYLLVSIDWRWIFILHSLALYAIDKHRGFEEKYEFTRQWFWCLQDSSLSFFCCCFLIKIVSYLKSNIFTLRCTNL